METVLRDFKTSKLRGFKSYYVVWKRFELNLEYIAFLKFKSYYVVWKLSTSDALAIQMSRLNRTM